MGQGMHSAHWVSRSSSRSSGSRRSSSSSGALPRCHGPSALTAWVGWPAWHRAFCQAFRESEPAQRCAT
jgi:hypothetical protein